MKENKILIIDAYNAFIRSYVVDPSVTEAGELIGGYKGFMKQLQKYLKESEPDEIYVVWDGTGGSRRRRSVNKNYKEGRKPINPNRMADFDMSPEERMRNQAWQVKTLINHLNFTPVKQLMVNDIEADDVIAYLAKCDKYSNDFKIILSNDKDFYQLLDSRTIVWRPATEKLMTTKDVLAEFDIHPHNMTIARAIVGDSSDNLPGVQGIGLKTVVKLFPELSSSVPVTLNEVFDKSNSLGLTSKSKTINSLVEAEDVVRTNYKIMQLYHPQISHENREIIQNCVDQENLTFNKVLFDAYSYKHELDDVNWSFMRDYFTKLTKGKK